MADINKLFEKAEKYLHKQKFESALDTYLQIYRYEPNDEEVLLNLGDLCLRLNRDSEGVRFQSQLADLYARKRDIPKAIATCRKILKVSPRDVNTLNKLGGYLERTHKTSEAVEVYRDALAQFRTMGAGAQALDCLQRIAKLDPHNAEVHADLGEQAATMRQSAVAAAAFLHAAQLARRNGDEDRWAEMVERAHKADPGDEAASIAAGELLLKKGQGAEVAKLLEPILARKTDDLTVLELVATALLQTKDLEKAQPLCWKLYQAKPEAIDLLVNLAEDLVQGGKIEPALTLLDQIKPRLFQQRKREDYLRIIESIYQTDESNLELLETLCGLYNDLNKEEGLRRSLGRLFGLYLAGEQYESAADTLERIIDVDPYGVGHYDRLLTLEGHIDKIWYGNISSRLQPPSAVRGAGFEGETAQAGAKGDLDDLIIEGEMYHQYQLESKLKETLGKINQLYPGAAEKNPRLRDLYQAAGMTPAKGAPSPGPAPQGGAKSPPRPPASQQSLEDLRRISEITANIYREGSSQGVLQVAVNEVGRALNASRCWGALGSPDRPPSLAVEYCSPSTPPSEVAASSEIYGALMRQASTKPDGWMMDDISKFPVLAPIMADAQCLKIQSLLALPLMDKDQPVGMLLLEQCDGLRAWTPGESLLLQTVATQVVIAVNNTKLRRLVRSIAGSDQGTGLLPRSSYLDCLLAEAARAKELAKPLSISLLEPENPGKLVKTLGDTGLQQYLQQVAKVLQANLRQNDIAVRYSPCAIALIFPDTPLPQGGLALEKLRRPISQVKLDGSPTPNLCCAICDVPLGLRFDSVDGVTEVINRLESVMEQVRKEGGKRVIISAFESA